MFFFGKKNKVDQSRDAMVDALGNLLEKTPSSAVTRQINELIDELRGQPPVSGNFVKKTDEKIMIRIKQIESDFARKDAGSAKTRLNSLKPLITSRVTGKEVSDYDAGYTDEELAELYVRRLDAEKKQAAAKMEKCKRDLLNHPKDALIASEYKLAVVNYKKADSLLIANIKQRERVTTIDAMHDLSDEYKRIIADESSSEEEFFRAAEEFNSLHADMARINDVTDQGIKNFTDASLTSGLDSDLKVNEVNYAELYGLTDEEEEQTSASSQKSSTAQAQSADGYNEDLFENVEEAIAQLEKAEELYTLKQNKAQRKYEENSQKLIELVTKYKSTPEALRGPIDRQIKSIYAENDTLNKEIKQYESARVKVQQNLKLQRSALVQKNIHSVDKILEGTSASTANIEAVAMQIKGNIESTNEDIEALGTANAVAESADPTTDALFDYEEAVNSASENADDKYDFLLKGLK